ncbi:MAG: hypothetical protein QNJ69_04400 [Gammaproteobacteria bacterium]|nr:hypothetical protein [Gammaproteobacteria bacterium]
MQWNAGGWFGGQVGATLWILVAGLLTAVRDLSTGLLVVALFVIPNVSGLLLWLSRRFSCYASTQIVIALAGVCGLVTVYVLEQANHWQQIQTGAAVSAYSTYWIIGSVFIGLMLTFHLRFGRGRHDAGS